MSYGGKAPVAPPRAPQPELDLEPPTYYSDYSGLKWILNAQHPRSHAHDEWMFQMSGQVLELWFKMLSVELAAARDDLLAGKPGPAIWKIRRADKIFDVAAHHWDVLDTMTHVQFAAFRDYLQNASGFHSFMYRHVEFLLGNKDKSRADLHRQMKQVHADLLHALAQPSMYDAAQRLLQARGYHIDERHLNRDLTQPYEADNSVEEAWTRVYRELGPGDDLWQLAEALLALSEKFGLFRYKHQSSTERAIGHRMGTGGTAGVDFLKRIVDLRIFPELWSLRTREW